MTWSRTLGVRSRSLAPRWRVDRSGDGVDADALGALSEVAATDGIAIAEPDSALRMPMADFSKRVNSVVRRAVNGAVPAEVGQLRPEQVPRRGILGEKALVLIDGSQRDGAGAAPEGGGRPIQEAPPQLWELPSFELRQAQPPYRCRWGASREQ